MAERAGRELKKTVLELGGSDAYIVLEDADVAAAARTAADARLVNSGQSCIAAKRFIVVEPVADQFLARFADELRSRRMGDPLSGDTQVGPQARNLREDRTAGQSRSSGSKALLGARSAGRGALYPPTSFPVERGAPSTRRHSGPSRPRSGPRRADASPGNDSVCGWAPRCGPDPAPGPSWPRDQAGALFVTGS